MDRYCNLTLMLALNPAAYTYYNGLPNAIRHKLSAQRENIHSLDELFRYTEILMRQA